MTMPDVVVTRDLVAIGLSRLLSQFRSAQPMDNPAGRTNIEKLTAVLLAPVLELEVVFQQLIQLRSVYTAVGATLALIGRLVGQLNNGQDDDTYRRFVIARIATNFSNGTRETMIRIAQLILNDANAKVVVNNLGPAASSVRIDGSPVTDTLASILISFLRQAANVGIQINLQSSPNPIADQFALGRTAYAAIDIATGANTIVVESTVGFPASGTLDIDFGLGVQEQVSYRLLDDVSFTLRAPTGNDHAIRAAVQLVDPSTGKGLGTIFDAGQPSLVPYANVGTIGGTLIDQRI